MILGRAQNSVLKDRGPMALLLHRDTLFVSQAEAYNRLSPSFRSYLETLQVVHSGFEQAAHSRSGKRGGVVKREPVKNVHPLVRGECHDHKAAKEYEASV